MFNNPFAKLRIKRDPDEVREIQHKTERRVEKELYVDQPEKKVKKVRPDDKKQEANNEEGFVAIKKKFNKRNYQNYEQYEEVEEQVIEEKKGGKQKFDSEGIPKKREYDRHVSGTGRGKEIQKDGKGGKHTWGNQDDQSQRYVKNFNNYRGGYNRGYGNERGYQDKFIEIYNDTKSPKEIKEEVVQPIEEIQANVEEVQAEEFVQENVEGPKDGKKKKKVEEDENKEPEFKRPENALSVSEYKQKVLGKKEDFVVVSKKEVEEKVDTKKKNKNKVDDKDITGNVQIKVVDETYDNKKRYANKNNKKEKFKFDAEEFPSL
jgi:hypothetical protein